MNKIQKIESRLLRVIKRCSEKLEKKAKEKTGSKKQEKGLELEERFKRERRQAR